MANLVDLRIPHSLYNRDSSLRSCIDYDFMSISVRIVAYSLEKLVSVHESSKVRIFKSLGLGRSDLKVLNIEDFHWSKCSGLYDCQTWIFHNLVFSKNIFLEDLVAKPEFNCLTVHFNDLLSYGRDGPKLW